MENIVWTGFGFHLSQGLFVLELQQKLYHFLLLCAERLLCDIDLPGSVAGEVAADIKQNSSLPNTTVTPDFCEWKSVSVLNTQASYRLPQSFPLESLPRLADAKRDAAEDWSWTLCEDPTIFQEQLSIKIEQSTEPSRKAFSTAHKPEEVIMAHASIRVVHDVCRDIIKWEAITSDMMEIENIKANLGAEILHFKRLPLRYERAMESFMALKFVAWDYAVQDMYRVLMSNHTFIDFFEVATDTGNRKYADLC